MIVKDLRKSYSAEIAYIRRFLPIGQKNVDILRSLSTSIPELIMYGIALDELADLELVTSLATGYFGSNLAEDRMSTIDLYQKSFWAYFSKWMLDGVREERRLRLCLNILEEEKSQASTLSKDFMDMLVLCKVFLGEVESARADVESKKASKKSSMLWQCLNAQCANDSAFFQKERGKYLQYLRKQRERLLTPVLDGFPYYVAYTHLFGGGQSFQDTTSLMFEGMLPNKEY